MKKLWCWALLLAGPLAGCNFIDDDEKVAQELNVNSRYTIESVQLSGEQDVTLSHPLRVELNRFVGAKLDRSALDDLASRIRGELRVSSVKVNVTRGTEPDHVIVDFEIKSQKHDLYVGKFLYDSKEGWSGDGGYTLNAQGNAFTFGLVSNNDTLIERYAGIKARYERRRVGTDRLRLRFEFDSFHDLWNLATLDAAPSSDIYRNRQIFTPMATVVIADPLELDFGVSFARFRVPDSVPAQTEGGGAAAAKTESSNAVVSTLRYHRRWGSDHDVQQQELTGSYAISSASNVFNTDQVFTRQLANGHYKYRHGHSSVDVGMIAGVIHGNAPLFERFVLGDSTTLRGWNRYDLDPLGGSHVLHGSIDYGFRIFQIFYDTGAIWDAPQEREQKQSVGVGFKKENFQLAVAFPMRSGRADPIFYAGMNF